MDSFFREKKRKKLMKDLIVGGVSIVVISEVLKKL
jgi:hypothetical protein